MTIPVEGSEPADSNIPEGTVQGEVTPDNTPGPNPSWEPVLSLLPQNFHSVVTPYFQEWDQAANKRIESLNSKFKDYEPFVEYGIGHDDLAAGVRLVNLLNENPQALYDALAQQLGTQQQPAPVTDETDPTEVPEYNLPPDYDKIKQGVEFLAQRALDAETKQAEAAANTQLESELKAAEAKHGTLNNALFLPYLSKQIADNPRITVDKAAENFVALRDEIINASKAAEPYAPNLLGANSGGGAGLPSNAIDPTKLNSTETKALVVQMLRAAQGGRQP